MALTLEDAQLTFQRAFQLTRAKPAVQHALRSLKLYMVGKKNVQLQLVPFDQTGNADSVIADVACRVYAVIGIKPSASTVDAWLKISDHATTAAANGDIVVKLINAESCVVIFPDGVGMDNGATLASHTTVNGSTDSSDADACAGYVIVGAV